MSKPVKVPDAVHDRLEREADERGIPMGAVVEDWMHDAERFDTLVRKGFIDFDQ